MIVLGFLLYLPLKFRLCLPAVEIIFYTPDDDERETLKDDLFYVKNDGDNVKLTWISAGLIKTYGVPSDGGKDDIVEDSVATSSAVIADMIGSF